MKHLLESIKLLSKNNIENKRVLVRVDFNVPLTEKQTVTDDTRIVKSLPTIELLLIQKNKIIIISHLGRPYGRDQKLSLKPIALLLQKLLPKKNILFIDDFLSEIGKKQLLQQTENNIVILENIRYYQGEQTNDHAFGQQLANLGDVYVNDAFGVSHRSDASVVGITKFLPSYCGLLLEQEIRAVTKLMDNPKRPVVAVIGGAKISTKIILLAKLMDIVDYLLLGGGIANTFLLAQSLEVGASLVEKNQVSEAKKIIALSENKKVSLLLPIDVSGLEDEKIEGVHETTNIPKNFSILDIGPKTLKVFSEIIQRAETIVWNGPAGLTEDKRFTKGTNAIFQAIVSNTNAFSLVGGGDTLASVSDNKDLTNITHISTGGGAMLELIENGTLPGIEALRQKQK